MINYQSCDSRGNWAIRSLGLISYLYLFKELAQKPPGTVTFAVRRSGRSCAWVELDNRES